MRRAFACFGKVCNKVENATNGVKTRQMMVKYHDAVRNATDCVDDGRSTARVGGPRWNVIHVNTEEVRDNVRGMVLILVKNKGALLSLQFIANGPSSGRFTWA